MRANDTASNARTGIQMATARSARLRSSLRLVAMIVIGFTGEKALDEKKEWDQGEDTGVARARSRERIMILNHRRRYAEGIICAVIQVENHGTH